MPKPQDGGAATVTNPKMDFGWAIPEVQFPQPSATISQPQNPQHASTQAVAFKYSEIVSIPVDSFKTTTTQFPDGRSVTVTENFPAGTQVQKSVDQNVAQEIGGSWFDTAREMAAKLGSFNKVQMFGVFLLVAAAAMFHRVVRVAVGGGKEIQMATAAIGLTLVFGPALIVGNERLFLFGGLAALIGWYGISRLSYYKGKSDAREEPK